MNSQLKIIFKENLIKVKLDKKGKVKDLLTYLRKTLNISSDSKLTLFSEDKKIEENEEFSELQKIKDKLVLIEDKDYTKSNTINLSPKKDSVLKTSQSNIEIKPEVKLSSNDNAKTNSSNNKNNIKKPSQPVSMAELIMKCTDAKEKIKVPKVAKRHRHDHHHHHHHHPILDMLFEEVDFGDFDDFDDEDVDGDDEDEDGFNENSSNEEEFADQGEIHIVVSANHGPFIIQRNPGGHASVQTILNRADQNPFIPPNQRNQINQGNQPNQGNLRVQIQVESNNNNIANPNPRPIRANPLINTNYDEELLPILIEMGFPENFGRIALRLSRNDFDLAAHMLVNYPDEFFDDNEELAGDNLPQNLNSNNNNIGSNVDSSNNVAGSRSNNNFGNYINPHSNINPNNVVSTDSFQLSNNLNNNLNSNVNGDLINNENVNSNVVVINDGEGEEIININNINRIQNPQNFQNPQNVQNPLNESQFSEAQSQLGEGNQVHMNEMLLFLAFHGFNFDRFEGQLHDYSASQSEFGNSERPNDNDSD